MPASDSRESVPLDAKPNQCELDTKRLPLQAPGADLVGADEALLGMRIGFLILAAVYDVRRIERS